MAATVEQSDLEHATKADQDFRDRGAEQRPRISVTPPHRGIHATGSEMVTVDASMVEVRV